MMRPDILTSYCLTKAAACHRENGPVDVKAILHAKPRDGDELIWQMAVDGNPVNHLPSALAFMVAGVGPLEVGRVLVGLPRQERGRRRAASPPGRVRRRARLGARHDGA